MRKNKKTNLSYHNTSNRKFSIENYKNKKYLVVRNKENKILERKKFEKKKYKEDLSYYKQENTFKRRTENKSYGKTYTFKSGKKITYRFYSPQKQKAKGINNDSRFKSYIIYIEGFIVKRRRKIYYTRSSDEHRISYPKEKAFAQAKERFFSDGSYMLSYGYDESEGKILAGEGKIQITNYYISYR